ncbi:MAG: WD40 repeat domain-containing protein, partial [Saprospiraceae bacterium]
MRILIVCLAVLFACPLTAQQSPAGRRKHVLSREFTGFTGENCFAITRKEADSAFRERSWDDAAALYRAAKSCADADQAGRSTMSLRIRACRDSAEQELLDKERSARRQARQAIASNRANDAQDLLKNFDRGLAYRLADFANQYIAPQGEYNAECLQAMFDSWYYLLQVQGNLLVRHDSLRVPLCYQLPEDGSRDGIIQFAGSGNDVKLYKLSPALHLLYVWDALTLRPEKPQAIDPAITNYQVSPDGHTVVFCGKDFFAFWQNSREVFRQKVSPTKTFVFSPDSNLFYYYDPEEKKIQSLDLRPKYVTQTRKGNNNANVIRPPIPEPIVSGLAEEPAAFAIRSDELWLGYLDSVVICRKNASGSPWQRSRVFVFAPNPDGGGPELRSTIQLFPEREAVLISSADSTSFYLLPTEPGRYSFPDPQLASTNQMLGIAPDASLLAKITPSTDGRGSQLYLIDPATGIFYFGAFAQPGDYFNDWQGVFSPDRRWFAVTNGEGLIKLWSLADRQSDRIVAYDQAMGIARLRPDGEQSIMESVGKIEAYPIPQRSATWSLETPNKNLGEMVLADKWMAYYAGYDSLLVVSPEHPQPLVLRVDANRRPGDFLVAFDPAGKYVAYAAAADAVVVRRLPDGVVVSKRSFVGSLRSLTFLPGRNAVIVVVQNATEFQLEQNVIKIWDFDRPAAGLSTVRLHGYVINFVAVSPLGDYIAFSDGNTVRIFDPENLDDEQASIRAFNNNYINSLVFEPDGRALAVGYNNGVLIFWNSKTGQFVFQFRNAFQSWTGAISQMAISPDGNRLRYLDFDNHLFERQLNPDSIRATAQTRYKQLAAFSPDQILQYNLEPALSYDNNFELLANSNDGPLIRSFFEFYRQQAITSNNIGQVGIYCQRAFELYKHLDQDF